MLGHILLAVDGSPNSRKAADFARTLVQGTTSRLTVVVALEPPGATVIPALDGMVFTAPHPSVQELAAARDMMDEIERALSHEHVAMRLEVGQAAEVVCRLAEELGVDLVVLGARGRNPVSRWLLGSVSRRVTEHAPCPVTVVR